MNLDAPFEALTAVAVEALYTRQAMEGPRLDYKQALLPLNDQSKFELLKDVCALANSEGGHLVYGIAQDDDGRPAKLLPFELNGVDELHNHIDTLLNDLIQERIPGLRHRAIEAGEGRFYYIIRVPMSPQAPHMITMPVTKARFYQRVNTVSAPMTIRQIKDQVLKAERAIDEATDFVHDRVKTLARDYESFAMMQVIPLYSEPYRIDMTDPAVYRKLNLLGSGNPRHCTEGYTVEWSTLGTRKHVYLPGQGRWNGSVHHSQVSSRTAFRS